MTDYVEFGICESPYYNYSCADVRNDPRVIRADNCSFESCHDGSRCSTFTRDVCPDVPDDGELICLGYLLQQRRDIVLSRCSNPSTMYLVHQSRARLRMFGFFRR